jgi:hypothetical protein
MFEFGDEGFRGVANGIKIYAVSESSFVAKAKRLQDAGVPYDFVYLGTNLNVSWSHRSRLPHRSVKPSEAMFRREFIGVLEWCIERLESSEAKVFFVVCDEEGKEAKKCIRFLLADFLIWAFEGMRLTDAEMDFVELLAAQIREKYALELGHYRVDGDVILWRERKNPAIIMRVFRKERVSNEFETDCPLMYAFYDFKTKRGFIYPRVNADCIGELMAEVVAKTC